MLRTNSKQARANVRAYILAHFNNSDYDLPAINSETEALQQIWSIYNAEKSPIMYARMPEFERFKSWASGLPCILDCGYYYNRSAMDDLAAILEETEAEAAKYNEQKAEETLTRLIWKELFEAIPY